MSTNRTKTGWAYKQAETIYYRTVVSQNCGVTGGDIIRGIAGIVRRAYKRGYRQANPAGPENPAKNRYTVVTEVD